MPLLLRHGAQALHHNCVAFLTLLWCRSALAQPGSGGSTAAAMQHAYLRSLTAKWLSRTRSDSPSTVLSLMQARPGRQPRAH